MGFKFQMNKSGTFSQNSTPFDNSENQALKNTRKVLDKTALLIIYKILNDILFLSLIFFGLSLIADGMVPGIITDRISFLKIILFIFFTLSAVYISGIFLNLKFSNRKTNKKTAIFMAAFSALIIFNSLYKLNLFLAFFITAITVIAGYFIYKNVLEN